MVISEFCKAVAVCGAAVLLAVTGCHREGESERTSASPSPDGVVEIPVKAPDIVEREWEIPSVAPGGPERSEPLLGEFRAAVRSKPREYEPRTHHLRPDRSPLYVNRLIRETSPYLLQHAHNPVDWHPWGDEAFALARSLGRPVLLSVGYSTCHWCHVMERESFEDLEIATFINSHFVPIKVDREERPDVDAVYMQVVQMLTGRGGWPMTVILTPEKQPIFGGTYFPARDGDRGSATGFLTVLQTLSARFAENPESVVADAEQVARRLQAASASRPAAGVPGAAVARTAVEQLSSTFDSTFGGFGRAPKFPRSVTLEFLLRYHRRTQDPNALHMAIYTLERMAAGGMRDHVGGGFHRYSTDARWLVPHFEKMLYDNALLVVAYLEGYQASARGELLAVAEDTLHYVAREMTDVRGGFYSATDADSAGPEGVEEEGRFFTWTDEEIGKAVGTRDAELVASAYGVSKHGNYENGRTILHAPGSIEVTARKAGVSVDVARKRLEEARQALYDVRAERTPPLKDTKIIAGWNGLMISAFARGALATGNLSYTQRATRAAEFIATEFVDADGRLARVWKDGKAKHAGVLEDYAFVVAGLLDLFEASSELRWLDLAVRLQQRLDEDFADRKGGYFLTATHAEDLLVRLKPDYDGAVPSGNSVAVMNLLRFGELLGEERYRAQAEKALRAFSPVLERSPAAVPKLLSALDFYLDKPKEIVVVMPDYEQDVSSFIKRLGAMFLPNRTLVVTRGGGQTRNLASRVPLLEGKVLLGDLATAYVCENRVCKRPTNSVDVFAADLDPVTPYP